MESNNYGNSQLKPFEYGYINMVLHVVLLLFTFGIWWFVWVYRVTDYLNRLQSEPRQTPIYQMLLCLVPFYSIYWVYKNADRIDKYAMQNMVNSDITIVSVVLEIFVQVAAAIIMQFKLNEIIQPSPASNYSYQSAGNAGSAGAGDGYGDADNTGDMGGYTYTTGNYAGQAQAAYQNSNQYSDMPSTGYNVLSFFFPIVGLILFLVWKDEFPVKAKAIGKWAIIGFCVGIVFAILCTIIVGCTAFVCYFQ